MSLATYAEIMTNVLIEFLLNKSESLPLGRFRGTTHDDYGVLALRIRSVQAKDHDGKDWCFQRPWCVSITPEMIAQKAMRKNMNRFVRWDYESPSRQNLVVPLRHEVPDSRSCFARDPRELLRLSFIIGAA